MDYKAIAAPAAFRFNVLGGQRLDSAVHTRAIDAGVQPAHAFVMIMRASFSDIANTLERLLRPSKQLTLHVFDANGHLPPPLPPDHIFHNLAVLEVRWETYPNLLVALLQRMPALVHLTLDLKDSWHDDPPQDPPPFALQTFTCRGRVWLSTQGWTWPISNPGTQRRLQSFSFKCDGAGTFTASFQQDPFAGLLTEARMYLSGGVDQPISTRDAGTLQRCTSLRSLELMVNWESRDWLARLEMLFAVLPTSLLSLALYPQTTHQAITDVYAVDLFLATQLGVARRLSALRDLTVSCASGAESQGDEFPVLRRACLTRCIRLHMSFYAPQMTRSIISGLLS